MNSPHLLPFYSVEELNNMNFASLGDDVQISRKCSIYQHSKIRLGNHVRIDDFTVLSGGMGLEIGNYVHIACFCALYGGGGISIGNYSTLSSRCAVYSVSDDFSGCSMTNPTVPLALKPGIINKRVTIAAHVVVGTNSTVLPGVTLHDGVAIGAHSLIKHDCDSWSIYAGSPARKLRVRSQIAGALASQLE
jgi:galactoside O-acetyltransferase